MTNCITSSRNIKNCICSITCTSLAHKSQLRLKGVWELNYNLQPKRFGKSVTCFAITALNKVINSERINEQPPFRMDTCSGICPSWTLNLFQDVNSFQSVKFDKTVSFEEQIMCKDISIQAYFEATVFNYYPWFAENAGFENWRISPRYSPVLVWHVWISCMWKIFDSLFNIYSFICMQYSCSLF